MSFNSYEFVFGFLPAIVAGFWLLARSVSRAAAFGWLLTASIGFSACVSLTSLIVLLPSVILDYGIGKAMLRVDSARSRRMLFVVGVAANIVFLGYFKYRNFF